MGRVESGGGWGGSFSFSTRNTTVLWPVASPKNSGAFASHMLPGPRHTFDFLRCHIMDPYTSICSLSCASKWEMLAYILTYCIYRHHLHVQPCTLELETIKFQLCHNDSRFCRCDTLTTKLKLYSFRLSNHIKEYVWTYHCLIAKLNVDFLYLFIKREYRHEQIYTCFLFINYEILEYCNSFNLLVAARTLSRPE